MQNDNGSTVLVSCMLIYPGTRKCPKITIIPPLLQLRKAVNLGLARRFFNVARNGCKFNSVRIRRNDSLIFFTDRNSKISEIVSSLIRNESLDDWFLRIFKVSETGNAK